MQRAWGHEEINFACYPCVAVTDAQVLCSGHGAMKENYFLDDGTYSASQILVEMVKRRLEGHGDLTEELLSELKEPAEAHEFRLKLKVGALLAAMQCSSEKDRLIRSWRRLREVEQQASCGDLPGLLLVFKDSADACEVKCQ